LAAKTTIKQVFPDFENSWVKKVEKQVVAGWNIFVTFSYPNSSETYEVVVYLPLPSTGASA
jgi:hypothetical protein